MQLGLAVDGFCNFGKRYSVWPLTLTMYNMPPWMRNKIGATTLVGLIPGPSSKNLQSYMQPMVDELLYLWHCGIEVVNAATQQPCLVKGMLVQAVADYPGLAKVLCMKKSPSPVACFFIYLYNTVTQVVLCLVKDY